MMKRDRPRAAGFKASVARSVCRRLFRNDRPGTRPRRWRHSAIASLLLPPALLIGGSASAATLNATWSGGGSGNWDVPLNWTPNGVPNNGADLYNVNIGSPSAVTVNGSFSIQSLDLAAGASALLPLGQSLTLNANGTINGSLNLGTLGSVGVSRLRVGADLTLGGTGTVDLHRSAGIDSPASARLTIGPGLTVRYHGQSGFDQVFFEPALTNNGMLLLEGDNALFNHPDGQFINSSTGTIRASNTVRVEISATNNAITIVNVGLWDADGGTFVLSFAEMTNTGIVRLRNGGVLRTGDNINNTGGTIEMTTGGRFIPTASGNLTITRGTITGGAVDQADPNAQGTLTLQGGPGADAMDISGTAFIGGAAGTLLALSGDFDFANNVQILRSVRVDGNVNVTGNGFMRLALTGGTANDTLTLGAGITLQATVPAAFSSVKTIITAGPVEIQGGELILSGTTFTISGPLHVFPGAGIATADGARLALQGNTAQLDAASEITGAVSLNGATVNGTGKLQRPALSVTGTNTVNVSITAPMTIVATGAAVLNGTAGVVSDGNSGSSVFSTGAPGATLTTGPDFDITVTNQNLTTNVPWRFQGNASLNGGAFVAAADLDNDGEIDLAGDARMQVNAGANVVAGSTGIIRVGPNARVEVTGPSTLGGSYEVSGDFVFAGGGVVPVVGDWDGDGNSEIRVNAGAIAQFSQPVSRVGTVTVNQNGSVSFDGGLSELDSATVNGAGAVLAVTGDTIATGTVNVQNNSTHRGAGTTTTKGPVEYRGTLDGRTLIADGPATIFQLTLQNNAVFENRNTATLFNFGSPDTVTGSGVLRNTGALVQSDFFGPAPNNITSTFQQTATGTTTISSELTVSGNSNIAGAVAIQSGSTLTFGAGTVDTTHTVSAAVTGNNATVEVTGNTTTGAATTVALNGPVNLSGPNSGTEVRDGGTLQVKGGTTSPTLGERVSVFADGELQIFGILGDLGRLLVPLFGLSENAKVKSPEEVALLEAQVVALTANSTPGPVIENTRVIVTERATVNGTTTLAGAVLEIAPGATADFRDGSRLSDDPTQAFADALLDMRGTMNVQSSPDPENPSPPVVVETALTVRQGGAVVVQAGATLAVSGSDGIALNSGALMIASNSLLSLGGGADLTNQPQGVIRGTGTLNASAAGSAFANEGEIAPGSSAGILTIIGDAPFSGTAKLSIELGGTNAGTQHDRLVITGAASLDGLLAISLINNFTPAPGDTFTILAASAGVTGLFDNAASQVSFPGGVFDVTYLANSVVLSNFAIPEPGTVLLASLGGTLLLFRRRERRRA